MSPQRCSHCWSELASGTRFCPGCGAPAPSPAKVFCTSCGQELAPGIRFCPDCGTALAATPGGPSPKPAAKRKRRSGWTLIGAAALGFLIVVPLGAALLIWVLRDSSTGQPYETGNEVTVAGVTLRRPAGWAFSVDPMRSMILAASQQDLTAPSPGGPRLVVETGGSATPGMDKIMKEAIPAGTDAAAAARRISLAEEPEGVILGGAPAVSFALREESGGRAVISRHVMVNLGNGRVYQFTLEAPAEQWAQSAGIMETTLRSAKFVSAPLVPPAKEPLRLTTPAAVLSPPREVTPTLSGPRVLLRDDFSNRESGFPTRSVNPEIVLTDYENGEYSMTFLKPQQSYVSSIGLAFADFALEIDARMMQATTTGAYGVSFRLQDASNGYRFYVDPNVDKYLLDKIEEGSVTTLAAWTSSTAIKGGVATNRLKVVAKGSAISVSVNGTLLTTVEDRSFSQGRIALRISSWAEPVSARFDNLLVATPD